MPVSILGNICGWYFFQIKDLSKNYQQNYQNDDSMDSESNSPFNQLTIYKQILDYMQPGETISKTLRRLGGNKSLSASERLKRKKAGLSSDNYGDSSKVTELTELANKILTKTGNMNIYQESHNYIKNLVGFSYIKAFK